MQDRSDILDDAGVTQYRSTFSTPGQAIAEALFLGLMASDDDSAQACAVLAEEIAADHGLDEDAVELAKAAALERFELETSRSA